MAKLTVKLVEEKLREYQGNCAAVARFCGVTRSAVTHYLERHPSLHSVARETSETMKDIAESALYKAVINGEGWAICFYLKTQAKDRGYIEKTVLEGGDKPPVVMIDWDTLVQPVQRVDEVEERLRQEEALPAAGGNGANVTD